MTEIRSGAGEGTTDTLRIGKLTWKRNEAGEWEPTAGAQMYSSRDIDDVLNALVGARKWRTLAMQAMRYLNAEQIEAASKAAGMTGYICKSAAPSPSDSRPMLLEPQPWESLTEDERIEWAPKGPYSYVIDGDDDETYFVIKGPSDDPLSFPDTADGSRRASRYVAWLNREHAAARPTQEGR